MGEKNLVSSTIGVKSQNNFFGLRETVSVLAKISLFKFADAQLYHDGSKKFWIRIGLYKKTDR